MMRAPWMLAGTLVLCGACRSQATADPKPVSSAVAPVAAKPPAKPRVEELSLWVEELTSDEIRAAIAGGTTTLIVGTGGIEPNGPHVVTGKHNYVLQTVLPYIARAIGQALIAPVVKFVPEGEIEPQPTGHMQHSGTLSVEPATFEALLSDICRSYAVHGFTDLVLIGDSGGNQAGMQTVAEALNLKWAAKSTRVHYLREYYYEDQWSYDYLKSLGITQVDKTPPAGEAEDRRADRRNGIHDDVYYEAQVAVQGPELIRMGRRIEAGDFSLHGVPLAPIEKTIELGKRLAVYRAGITARAFEASQRRLRNR
jgi:hypothetical protein